MRRKAPGTVASYVKAVEELARYYRRSPDWISTEEIRDYMHFLIVGKKLSYSSCNHKIVAINFFFREVAGRKLDLRVPMKRSGRLPEPLSREEVARLLDAAENQKHRVLMMTAYSAGLRVSELVRLKPQNIHSDRMLIQVNQGKGRKDRYTLLAAVTAIAPSVSRLPRRPGWRNARGNCCRRRIFTTCLRCHTS